MWETFKTWFLANQDGILVPAVSTILGAIVLAVAAGLWKYFSKAKPTILQPAIVPLDQYDAKADELGVTKTALRNFFKILEHENVGQDDLDAKLREIAARHKKLMERIAAIPDVDQRSNDLRDAAKAAIADGRYDDADAILHDAESQDLQATAELEDQLRTRKMAAAASAYARGELAATRFKYQDAASHFLRAASHYPDNAHKHRIEALNFAGRAFYEAAAFKLAEDAYEQARDLAETHLNQTDPLTTTVLNNLAQLYQDTNRLGEAEPLMVRAVGIFTTSLGAEHPHTVIVAGNLELLRQLRAARGE